ncbi:DUF4232 domain-containing protein [Amycolatopsis rhizosphaerae]|uniref:DUF4232 domain-containing protein n=1 Tax=Amycolatopsis rhizosphaerae TaxID=2053003 RepID=A0A558D6I0_9PSEU|nr:DUF4232 domain-containing protein [Amycolatopsis rhizosphaerae]TVT56615.1 DUF4232 domain-containing protein [Amycolatopsis rhizosphaerae]
MNVSTKPIRRGTIAIAVVAVAGALGACSTGQPGNATPVPQAAGGTGGSVSATTDSATTAGGTRQGADANGAPDTNGAAGRGVATAGGHPNCTALKVTQSSPDLANGTSTQWKLPIMLTNQSSAPCTVQGFPGVRLEGEDGTTWDLIRAGGTGAPVLLGPGEHATADLTYLTATAVTGDGSGAGSGWHVAHMAVTPPNSTNTQTLPWADSLDLVKQDSATHPGTYIGSVHPSTAK